MFGDLEVMNDPDKSSVQLYKGLPGMSLWDSEGEE